MMNWLMNVSKLFRSFDFDSSEFCVEVRKDRLESLGYGYGLLGARFHQEVALFWIVCEACPLLVLNKGLRAGLISFAAVTDDLVPTVLLVIATSQGRKESGLIRRYIDLLSRPTLAAARPEAQANHLLITTRIAETESDRKERFAYCRTFDTVGSCVNCSL